MDLIRKSFIKNLLKSKSVYPSKKLGQNFLVSKIVLKKIIEAADIKKEDTILEIGPGIGALTYELAKLAGKVVAIEKDKKMIEILKEALKDFDNVVIIQNDVLKTNPNDCQIQTTCPPESSARANSKRANYKLISNLPYYITSPVIKKFLETEIPPKQMILMVQKEVAQRICAKPPKMNLLAIAVQFYSKPEIISYVPRKSFWPVPKVDSAILKIILPSDKFAWAHSRFASQARASAFRVLFFKIVRAGFAHPRKQLVNNLSSELKLTKEKAKKCLIENNIKPEQRAQTLSIQDWVNLTKFKARR